MRSPSIPLLFATVSLSAALLPARQTFAAVPKRESAPAVRQTTPLPFFSFTDRRLDPEVYKKLFDVIRQNPEKTKSALEELGFHVCLAKEITMDSPEGDKYYNELSENLEYRDKTILFLNSREYPPLEIHNFLKNPTKATPRPYADDQIIFVKPTATVLDIASAVGQLDLSGSAPKKPPVTIGAVAIDGKSYNDYISALHAVNGNLSPLDAAQFISLIREGNGKVLEVCQFIIQNRAKFKLNDRQVADCMAVAHDAFSNMIRDVSLLPSRQKILQQVALAETVEEKENLRSTLDEIQLLTKQLDNVGTFLEKNSRGIQIRPIKER